MYKHQWPRGNGWKYDKKQFVNITIKIILFTKDIIHITSNDILYT